MKGTRISKKDLLPIPKGIISKRELILFEKPTFEFSRLNLLRGDCFTIPGNEYYFKLSKDFANEFFIDAFHIKDYFLVIQNVGFWMTEQNPKNDTFVLMDKGSPTNGIYNLQSLKFFKEKGL